MKKLWEVKVVEKSAFNGKCFADVFASIKVSASSLGDAEEKALRHFDVEYPGIVLVPVSVEFIGFYK